MRSVGEVVPALEGPGGQGGTAVLQLGSLLERLAARRCWCSQMAAALFITEKTVSAQVSNLLRKTGTDSRVELAARARIP